MSYIRRAMICGLLAVAVCLFWLFDALTPALRIHGRHLLSPVPGIACETLSVENLKVFGELLAGVFLVVTGLAALGLRRYSLIDAGRVSEFAQRDLRTGRLPGMRELGERLQ